MYPNLSYVLHDIFGTPLDRFAFTQYIQMFGTFLALAFITAAYLLTLELRRKYAEGLLPTHLTKDESGQMRPTTPEERVGDITMVAAIGGLLGAKIFAIFESAENVQSFLADPVGTFFTPDGLAIYGGLIGGFISVYYFIRKKLNINPLYMMDAVAPSLMAAYAVGRIGCQLSGDGDWGIIAGAKPSWWIFPDWMWSYDYARNVLRAGVEMANSNFLYNHHLPQGVYPTPLYETVMAGLLALMLWSIRKKLKTPGMLFMIYLIVNGVERFFIEKIRVNDKIHALGLTFTQAELIAVLFVLIGIVGAFILKKKFKSA